MFEQYSTLARYYDKIYHWKDYRKEAGNIRELVRENKQSSGNDLLDVGCGTGRHILYLRDAFNCVGVDISGDMLRVARRNVPGVQFIRSSMTDFRLRTKFDVVLCLFSSIGYLKTREELIGAFSNFARHMNDGGVLILEPWFRKSDWERGSVHMRNYESHTMMISRVGYSKVRGRFSVMDERYLIAQKGKGITYVEDHQEMRFFEPSWTFNTMRKAGLSPRFAKVSVMPGRAPIIAIKRRHAAQR